MIWTGMICVAKQLLSLATIPFHRAARNQEIYNDGAESAAQSAVVSEAAHAHTELGKVRRS